MKEYRLPQNEKLVKEYLFTKISGTQVGNTANAFSGRLNSILVLKFAGALVILLIILSFATRDNVALAEFNPLATPTAKAKHVLKQAISNVELETNRKNPGLPDNSSTEAKELHEAFNAKDLKFIGDNQDTEEENTSRSNQQFQVDGQTVESLGQALRLKPKEVKKQVRFTRQDGSTVFLGFNRDGEVIFKAESTTEGKGEVNERDEQGESEQEAPKEKVKGARSSVGNTETEHSPINQTSKPLESTSIEQNPVRVEPIKPQEESSEEVEKALEQKQVETETH